VRDVNALLKPVYVESVTVVLEAVCKDRLDLLRKGLDRICTVFAQRPCQAISNHFTHSLSEYRIGGTSLSSPIMAGIMALADQAAGHPHGFANPLFYNLAGGAAFTDIVSPASTVAVVRTNYVNNVDPSAGLTYRLRTMNQTLSLQTTPGYDDVTGLGTPTSSFLSALL